VDTAIEFTTKLVPFVGSTEASNGRLARVGRIDRSHLGSIGFGVVGPTRATRLSVLSVDLIPSRLTRPCSGGAGSLKVDGPVHEPGLTAVDRTRYTRPGVDRF